KGRVKLRRVRAMSMTIQSSVKDKILATPIDTSKVENVLAEMLRDLDQQMEKRADDDAAESVRDAIGFESHVLWAEIGESSLTGLELVQETADKVVLEKEKPKAARDRQKSYVDYRCKPLEFEVGDHVLLKVAPCKGVFRF
nr:reverse transcriptase domain-containing protein [Tanacetum cinerariifolium]